MKFTYSTLFLYPLLEIPFNLFNVSKYVNKKYISTRFLNSYLGHEDMNIPENCICVVYCNFMDKDQVGFQDTLESLDGFQFSYSIVDSYFGVSVFQIPDHHLEAYNLFLNGKYSQYPELSKTACLAFLPKKSELKSLYNLLLNIFNKDEYTKTKLEEKLGVKLSEDSEIFSIYNLEKELINESNLINLKLIAIEYGSLWQTSLGKQNILGESDDPFLG